MALKKGINYDDVKEAYLEHVVDSLRSIESELESMRDVEYNELDDEAYDAYAERRRALKRDVLDRRQWNYTRAYRATKALSGVKQIENIIKAKMGYAPLPGEDGDGEIKYGATMKALTPFDYEVLDEGIERINGIRGWVGPVPRARFNEALKSAMIAKDAAQEIDSTGNLKSATKFEASDAPIGTTWTDEHSTDDLYNGYEDYLAGKYEGFSPDEVKSF